MHSEVTGMLMKPLLCVSNAEVLGDNKITSPPWAQSNLRCDGSKGQLPFSSMFPRGLGVSLG